MREILFRVFVPALNRYLRPTNETFYLNSEGEVLILKNSDNYSIEELYGPHFIEIYTGLTDIEGNKIFEGDIFHTPEYPFHDNNELNYLGVVEYMDDPSFMGWHYELTCINPKLRGSACGSGLPDLEGHPITVIGNIRQNPELADINIKE